MCMCGSVHEFLKQSVIKAGQRLGRCAVTCCPPSIPPSLAAVLLPPSLSNSSETHLKRPVRSPITLSVVSQREAHGAAEPRSSWSLWSEPLGFGLNCSLLCILLQTLMLVASTKEVGFENLLQGFEIFFFYTPLEKK